MGSVYICDKETGEPLEYYSSSDNLRLCESYDFVFTNDLSDDAELKISGTTVTTRTRGTVVVRKIQCPSRDVKERKGY